MQRLREDEGSSLSHRYESQHWKHRRARASRLSPRLPSPRRRAGSLPRRELSRPQAALFPRSNGPQSGPAKDDDLDSRATIVYVTDVHQEVLQEYAEALEQFTGGEKQKALDMVWKITLARAPAANLGALARSRGKSRATYYRWRKEGQMFLGQLDRIESNQIRMESNQARIENKLDHLMATNDIRAIQLFRAIGELDEEADVELDSEA